MMRARAPRRPRAERRRHPRAPRLPAHARGARSPTRRWASTTCLYRGRGVPRPAVRRRVALHQHRLHADGADGAVGAALPLRLRRVDRRPARGARARSAASRRSPTTSPTTTSSATASPRAGWRLRPAAVHGRDRPRLAHAGATCGGISCAGRAPTASASRSTGSPPSSRTPMLWGVLAVRRHRRRADRLGSRWRSRSARRLGSLRVDPRLLGDARDAAPPLARAAEGPRLLGGLAASWLGHEVELERPAAARAARRPHGRRSRPPRAIEGEPAAVARPSR